MDEPILITRDGALATITLNRPAVLNALNGALLDRLEAALHEVDADRADRLAERAEADAQLAIAKAREQTAQNSARQIQDGLATLRNELNQNVNSAPPAPAGPVPGNNSEENNHDRS